MPGWRPPFPPPFAATARLPRRNKQEDNCNLEPPQRVSGHATATGPAQAGAPKSSLAAAPWVLLGSGDDGPGQGQRRAEGVRGRVRLRRPLPRRRCLQVMDTPPGMAKPGSLHRLLKLLGDAQLQDNGSGGGGRCGSGARGVHVRGALQLRSLRLRSYGITVGGRTGGVHVRTGLHLRAVFDGSLRRQPLPEPCHTCLLE
ncbi:hypothetical protein MUK42_07187 [Musa troglodytarum]|uniref:Uncharacterized protein n=1 Tax=Musa troglodytarum TaxID=320322 RepID=A0A9E7KWD3_9LILI|nr:hypothetical protein MUK42_07187 [Musa troglodytarum]